MIYDKSQGGIATRASLIWRELYQVVYYKVTDKSAVKEL